MVTWAKLFLLLLLVCSVGADKKPNDDQLFDFSREDAEKPDEYYNEHDENEIGHEYSHENNPDLTGLLVCDDNGVAICHCDKKYHRVDCNIEKLTGADKGTGSRALLSADIRVKVDGLDPKYVYLTHNKITHLYKEELLPGMEATVEGIDFGFNDIREIYGDAFGNFKNLKKLRLNHNWIVINNATDDWITEKLGNTLKILNLAYNGILTINDGAFDPLHQLDRLILDGNKNITLKKASFGKDGLKSLTVLSLDYCNLPKFDDDDLFENLPKLAFLSLIGNPLTGIPKALGLIKGLSSLDLSDTQLKKLENSPLAGFGSVKRLFLKDMKNLTEIGDCAFCGLTSMTHIDLSDSIHLEKIHENALGFANGTKEKTLMLAHFQMENCNMTTLPEKLYPWVNLQEIVLGGNPLNCGKEMHYFIYGPRIHTLTGKKAATCASPPEFNGTRLQKMIDDAHSGSGIGGFFKTIFYMGISMAIVGTLLTVILHVSKKYDGSIRNLFTRQRPNGAGFSNLNADVNMEDERVFEEEEDNEFEPRPAAV